MRDRCAEDCHHRVADELLDGPAETLDLALDPRVVRAQRGTHVFRVGAVGAVREADEVDEEDRDDLALLSCVGGRRERRAAREAVAGARRVLLATAGTGSRHGRSLELLQNRHNPVSHA
jgi:hypothetical protein